MWRMLFGHNLFNYDPKYEIETKDLEDLYKNFCREQRSNSEKYCLNKKIHELQEENKRLKLKLKQEENENDR